MNSVSRHLIVFISFTFFFVVHQHLQLKMSPISEVFALIHLDNLLRTPINVSKPHELRVNKSLRTFLDNYEAESKYKINRAKDGGVSENKDLI